MSREGSQAERGRLLGHLIGPLLLSGRLSRGRRRRGGSRTTREGVRLGWSVLSHLYLVLLVLILVLFLVLVLPLLVLFLLLLPLILFLHLRIDSSENVVNDIGKMMMMMIMMKLFFWALKCT